MKSNTELPFLWPPGDPALSGFHFAGKAPGGIFMHGFRSHCDGEKAVSLARHAESRGRAWLRYNQRYCGRGNDAFVHYTVGQSINDLVSILDFLGQPVILVGSSLGAVISLQAAEIRPAAISGMLLIAPAYRFVMRHFEKLPLETIRRWRSRGFLDFPDYYEGGEFPLGYGFYEDALRYADPGPWKFNFPVAILHGENDELLPPDDSRELQQRIRAPSVTLDIVPEGDHRLQAAIPLMCRKIDFLWKLG